MAPTDITLDISVHIVGYHLSVWLGEKQVWVGELPGTTDISTVLVRMVEAAGVKKVEE